MTLYVDINNLIATVSLCQNNNYSCLNMIYFYLGWYLQWVLFIESTLQEAVQESFIERVEKVQMGGCEGKGRGVDVKMSK